MVSILIPVYNYSIIGLAKELIVQTKELECPFEILFLDDHSSDTEISFSNQLFCKENQLIYIISDRNLGRAKARNYLAGKARYEWLLFLDSDVFPVDNFFLRTYITSITDNISVFSGNIVYRKNAIAENKQKLRWKYGTEYEEVSLEQRLKDQYLHVKSANLFIKKETFFQVGFPVLSYNYGFEDTLFGLTLQERGVELRLLENPVYHDGLENNKGFLDKTEEALKNLADLIRGKDPLCEGIKIVRIYFKLQKTGADRLVRYFFNISKRKIRKNLLSKNPSTQIFQLYKLGYLCDLLARE